MRDKILKTPGKRIVETDADIETDLSIGFNITGISNLYKYDQDFSLE